MSEEIEEIKKEFPLIAKLNNYYTENYEEKM